MRVSELFRTLLVLGVLALLLGVASSAQGSRRKKEGKSRGAAALNKPKRSSRGKMRKLWVNLNADLINSSGSSPLSPRLSISPWTYEASYDESRIPSHIFEAKCEKKGCMTLKGEENIGLFSRPIYYQILVLRRVKGKKKDYSLKLEKMTISVGCTCTLPTFISQM